MNENRKTILLTDILEGCGEAMVIGVKRKFGIDISCSKEDNAGEITFHYKIPDELNETIKSVIMCYMDGISDIMKHMSEMSAKLNS